MKRLILIIWLLALLVSACAAPAATPTFMPLSKTPQPAIASLTPAASSTPPLTSTLTPVPPTATLDLAHMPRATRQSEAVCPVVNAKARFPVAGLFRDKKAAFHDLRQPVLEFLNQGGDPQVVVERFAENGIQAVLMDLTNDNVPELFLPSGYLSFFGCQAGKFVTLLEFPLKLELWSAVALAFQDLNGNGIPELVIAQPTKDLSWINYAQYAEYSIYEWDGSSFAKLLGDGYQSRNGTIFIEGGILHTIGHSRASQDSINGNWQLSDLDGNGLKDLTILAGINASTDTAQLEEKVTLQWDGQKYIVAATGIEATQTPTPSRTPQPVSASCEYKAPELRFVPTRGDSSVVAGTIQEFLNAGGDPKQLNAYFGTNIRDLNGDSLPDILLFENGLFPSAYLFTCVNGKYQDLLNLADNGLNVQFSLLSIEDLNKDGLPEIVIKDVGCTSICAGSVYILEWDGKRFSGLIKTLSDGDDYAFQYSPDNTSLKDIDQDGFAELIWDGGIPNNLSMDFVHGKPWRHETHVYKWDGTNYVEQPTQYSDPAYRFQAVQDGDRAALQGDYAGALHWYQKVITSDGLDWWSPEKQQYGIDKLKNELGQTGKSVLTPVPDTSERPRLSAYAYFRMMLVELLTGKPDEAGKDYQILQSSYPGTDPGSAYREMAEAFWKEYQLSGNMKKSCQTAVDYANHYPYILRPLGGDYHGMQSLQYHAPDVCPFH